MKELLFSLMTKISGQPYNPAWEGKVFSIFYAVICLSVLLGLIIFYFYRYFWQDKENKRLDIAVTVIFFAIAVGKFVLFKIKTGYIPDRLLFYALPSPKIENPLWFILAAGIFAIFLRLREKMLNLDAKKFLLSTCVIFFVFSSLVAGIREGAKSIIDPMTRTYWEYTGNIPLIVNTHDFLRDYIILQPKLVAHATTHPPGYSLLVYYFDKISGGSMLGISLFLILSAGLSIFPLYFLLKNFFEERTVRKILQLYIFVPSIVLMSGTSLEAFFVTIVWITIALMYIGWNKSRFLSVLGGISAGIALLSNFLFLLLAPIFLAMFIYVWQKSEMQKRAAVVVNLIISFLSFVLFFVFLWQWTDYSIIENFLVAKAASKEAVMSNFQSAAIYAIFFIMNILDFGFALGIVNLLSVMQSKKEIFLRNRPELWLGFAYVLFLVVIGVFQGELLRLWMFVVPFFLFSFGVFVEKISERKFSLVLSLLFLQIIFTQVLFYTYW